jgi:hypothetical protein
MILSSMRDEVCGRGMRVIWFDDPAEPSRARAISCKVINIPIFSKCVGYEDEFANMMPKHRVIRNVTEMLEGFR